MNRTVSNLSEMSRALDQHGSRGNLTARNLASHSGGSQSGGGGGPTRDLETASDTSSARERRFAEQLGPEPDYTHAGLGSRNARNVRRHRLHEIGVAAVKAKEERLQVERDRVLMQEMQEMTQRPNITKHARERAAKRELFYDHAQKWLERKMETRERLASEQEAQNMEEVHASPAISQKSRILTEGRHYIHPIDGWEIRFSEYLAKKQFDEVEPEHTPNISRSVRSAAGASFAEETPGDSVEAGRRLFEESMAREQRREALLKQLVKQELTDPVTGRRYFKPQVSKAAMDEAERSNRDAKNVGMSLFLQAQERQKKREEMHDKKASAETGCTFQPAINPMSGALSKAGRKPLFDPTWRKGKQPEASDSHKEKKALTKPLMDDFLRRNHEGWHDMKRAKLREIRQTMHVDAMTECSFHPQISRRSHELFLSANSSGVPMEHSSAPKMQRVSNSKLDGIFSQSPLQPHGKRSLPRNDGDGGGEYGVSGSPPQLPSTAAVMNAVFDRNNNNSSNNNNNQNGAIGDVEAEFAEAADAALRAAGLPPSSSSRRSATGSSYTGTSSSYYTPSGSSAKRHAQQQRFVPATGGGGGGGGAADSPGGNNNNSPSRSSVTGSSRTPTASSANRSGAGGGGGGGSNRAGAGTGGYNDNIVVSGAASSASRRSGGGAGAAMVAPSASSSASSPNNNVAYDQQSSAAQSRRSGIPQSIASQMRSSVGGGTTASSSSAVGGGARGSSLLQQQQLAGGSPSRSSIAGGGSNAASLSVPPSASVLREATTNSGSSSDRAATPTGTAQSSAAAHATNLGAGVLLERASLHNGSIASGATGTILGTNTAASSGRNTPAHNIAASATSNRAGVTPPRTPPLGSSSGAPSIAVPATTVSGTTGTILGSATVSGGGAAAPSFAQGSAPGSRFPVVGGAAGTAGSRTAGGVDPSEFSHGLSGLPPPSNTAPLSQAQQEQVGAMQNQMYSLLNEWQQLENV